MYKLSVFLAFFVVANAGFSTASDSTTNPQTRCLNTRQFIGDSPQENLAATRSADKTEPRTLPSRSPHTAVMDSMTDVYKMVCHYICDKC